MDKALYHEAFARTEAILNGLWAVVGPLTYEQTAAVMDGIHDAYINWTPKEVGK